MLAIRIVLAGFGLLCLAPSHAAATIDLTTLDARAVNQGVIYTQGEASATPSIQFQPFLRVQAIGAEQGFNTDFRPLEPDAIGTPPVNHSLLISSLSRKLITTPSTQYVYEFNMDVNETISSGQSYLSIDQLRLYAAPRPMIGTFASLEVNGPLLYDLDAAGDETILLDSALEPGSGIPELTIQVPTTILDAAPPEFFPYLYVFFRAGGVGLVGGRNYASSGGFEEVLANMVSSPTAVEAEAGPAAAPWIRVIGGPFTEQVRFRFAAPSGDVRITIHDVRGREIASYRGAAGGASVRDVGLEAFSRTARLGSGVYFYRYTTQGVTRATGKVALVH